jgi:sigma-B regulation protein RsbU (phosphoserine phosphatase)
MQGGLKRLQQLALQDRELEIASSIQRNLLPRTSPTMAQATVVPVQRQANLVGGDWYDFEEADGILSIAVGDASGKGIAAALMATVALSALRAERGLGSSPGKVVTRANQALLEATESDSFTTLIYATLELATGQLRCLNMGHLSPYIVRRAEGSEPTGAYIDGPRNRALGWFEEPGLAELEISLQPGDRLVLFTDGFLEAKAPDGELFGEDRLAETLSRLGGTDAGDVGEEAIREVERFAAGKLEDDLTMLILDFEGARHEVAPTERTHEGV